MKKERPPYDFDELIKKLEDIRDEKQETLNHPRAFYTICLKIKEMEKYLKSIDRYERGYDD